MKLLLLTNIPSPYMIDFLNELGKLCELTVVFEKESSDERDESWKNYNFKNFTGIILKGLNTSVDSAACPQVIKFLSPKLFDEIVVTNPTTPTGIIAILYMKMRKINYILESEGGFPKNGRGAKERLKRFLMSNAKFYFTTTGVKDEYFLKYGAEVQKLVTYPFTSIYNKEVLDKPVSKSEKKYLREKHGIESNKVIVAVGRFIPLKQFDILIRACSKFDNTISLVLVGGGVELDHYKQICNDLEMSNVIFRDFMNKEILFDYYKLADLLVHPTSSDVWGLVINEAMANALPVITTKMCIAGRVLVEDRKNGYLLEECNEDILFQRINDILSDDFLSTEMSLESLRRIKWYTFENMAKSHIDSINDWRSK